LVPQLTFSRSSRAFSTISSMARSTVIDRQAAASRSVMSGSRTDGGHCFGQLSGVGATVSLPPGSDRP
jgi:hypothetical protein